MRWGNCDNCHRFRLRLGTYHSPFGGDIRCCVDCALDRAHDNLRGWLSGEPFFKPDTEFGGLGPSQVYSGRPWSKWTPEELIARMQKKIASAIS